MSKTITLRLPDEVYKKILASAEAEHRPISNFIMHVVVEKIEKLFYVDNKEMEEILSDEKLMKRLKAGHKQAKDMKGRFVE